MTAALYRFDCIRFRIKNPDLDFSIAGSFDDYSPKILQEVNEMILKSHFIPPRCMTKMKTVKNTELYAIVKTVSVTDIKHIFTKMIIILKKHTRYHVLLTRRLLDFLVLCDSTPCDLPPLELCLFDAFGLTFSSSSESGPLQFSSSSSKSNNSMLSSSSLSKTGIFRRFWLVDFALVGFCGLGALRGVLRGMGLGSSSLSSTVFFCRFFFVAGVRPF